MTMSAEQSERVQEVIRLPNELPGGWEKHALVEVAEIIMGQSPSSEYYNTERKGLPFFQGKAEFSDLYPEAVKWCSAPGKLAQKDDILISVRAPVGPTNLAPSECCIGRGLAAIRPRHGIPSKYILHYLRSIEKDIDPLGTGTTFKAISGKTLREIPLPIAPLDQQKRIVAEIEKQFSRLDEAVANLNRVKANLKRYKGAVLKTAAEGRLVETEAELARREGRSFETGEQLLQRILKTRRSQWKGKGKYKEPAAPDTTDLPELPEGWVWASPKQLSAGEPYSLAIGPFGSSLKVSDYTDTGVPLVFVRNIRAVSFGGPDTVYVSEEKAEELRAHRVNAGDLLVTKMGDPPGDVCIYPTHRPPAVITADCIKLRLTQVLASAQFFVYAIESDLVHKQLLGITKGVAQLKVSLGRFALIGLPQPPLAE